MFEKNKEIDYLQVDESNFICSKCLIKMHKIVVKNTTINICSKCRNVFINEEDLDNTIQFFLRKAKFL